MKNTRYTRDEMEAAFKLVANKEHWKNPIDAVVVDIDPAMIPVIEDAVIYFTGSQATVTHVRDGWDVRVQADGYYVAVGA